jgi:predicted methyltransferase
MAITRLTLLLPSLLLLSLVLASCTGTSPSTATQNTLDSMLALRSDEDRARDSARHPAETLVFFQVEPGMTVAEALPGRGWYTNILANYLGGDGVLYGVNYSDRMFHMFGPANAAMIAKRIASTALFPSNVASFTDNGIAAQGFTFETVPEGLTGSVDRMLFIRALHNLNRFEADAGTRTAALAACYDMLADDGLVGVVQHRAPESAQDDGAVGNRGYLKQSAVIAMFEEAGFKLVTTSEINANPKDRPDAEDIVWRLPPSLRGSEGNAEQRAAVLAIGESDRMTLLFRKQQ